MGQLEPTTQAFIDSLAGSTPIYTLAPEDGSQCARGRPEVGVGDARARAER